MKLLVLHTRLSGYMISCLKAYHNACGAEMMIVAWPQHDNAPFDRFVDDISGRIHTRTDYDVNSITRKIGEFVPDAVLLSGWSDNGYVSICRILKNKGVPIISGCDTQWIGSLRQKMACLTAPLYVKRFIDVLWVCGHRQQKFAEKLGYNEERCWTGYYSCDWDNFAHQRKTMPESSAFLYIGRYVPEKGIDILVNAYKLYRNHVDNPWPLICAGEGPLKHLLESPGIEIRGFVQPRDLPGLMAEASAFALPSLFEPWGVVIHEAAASGLPLILTDACGAGDHLLQHESNGFLIKAGVASELANAMVSMHRLEKNHLLDFGRKSYELSLQYTPQIWADTLHTGLNRVCR